MLTVVANSTTGVAKLRNRQQADPTGRDSAHVPVNGNLKLNHENGEKLFLSWR